MGGKPPVCGGTPGATPSNGKILDFLKNTLADSDIYGIIWELTATQATKEKRNAESYGSDS